MAGAAGDRAGAMGHGGQGRCTPHLQKLIDRDADDLEANNALANLYERQSRRRNAPNCSTRPIIAIKRVVANRSKPRGNRTEALSLMGRNAKTQWRQAFEGIQNVAERRKRPRTVSLSRPMTAIDGLFGGSQPFLVGTRRVADVRDREEPGGRKSWEDAFDT